MTADPTVHAIFGMGTWETLIILVVALVFLGPDKLPEVAKSIGKGLRTVRRAMSSVEYEVQAMTQPDRYEPPPQQRHAPPPASDSPSSAGHHDIDPADIATDAAEDPHAPPHDYDLHTDPAAETPQNASAETPQNASAETPQNASTAPVTNASGAVSAPHPLRPMAPPAPVAAVDAAPEDAPQAAAEPETEAEAS